MAFLDPLLAFFQILLIDIAMSGDNAIAVGMAASGLPPGLRHRAVLVGIVAATLLRVIFALFAVKLMHINGLIFAGGLVLLWVVWKMYEDVRHHARMAKKHEADASEPEHKPQKKLSSVITQIVVADVSMSLDNVLAVAGVARDDVAVLVLGIIISVILMGTASALIARLTTRHPWVGYAGVVIVFYTAARMIWDGSQQLMEVDLF